MSCGRSCAAKERRKTQKNMKPKRPRREPTKDKVNSKHGRSSKKEKRCQSRKWRENCWARIFM